MDHKRNIIAVSVAALLAPPRFDDEITFTQADVDALVSGLKNKNQELIDEKKVVRDQLQEMKASLAAFDGIDPVQIKELMTRFENDDEAKLIKEGKISEVINTRVAKNIEAADRKVQEAMTAVEVANSRASKFSQKVLDDSLRAAAIEAGVHKSAIPDVLLAGRSIFQLDNDGNAIQKKDESIVMGADGKTPFAPGEWMGSMKESRPHWFPAGSSGSSHSQGNGGAAGEKTIKRSAFLALSPEEQAVAIKTMTPVDD